LLGVLAAHNLETLRRESVPQRNGLQLPFFSSLLVNEVRQIAADRDTTLTAMIRDYLENVAEEASGKQRRERAALEKTFEEFQFRVGQHSWKRADLHAPFG
jgi:hypothetical protein